MPVAFVIRPDDGRTIRAWRMTKGLAGRIRERLRERLRDARVNENKMFGGLADRAARSFADTLPPK